MKLRSPGRMEMDQTAPGTENVSCLWARLIPPLVRVFPITTKNSYREPFPQIDFPSSLLSRHWGFPPPLNREWKISSCNLPQMEILRRLTFPALDFPTALCFLHEVFRCVPFPRRKFSIFELSRNRIFPISSVYL